MSEKFKKIPRSHLPENWEQYVPATSPSGYLVQEHDFMRNMPVSADYNVLQENRSTFELLNEDQGELIEKIHKDLSKEGCC